MDDKTFPAQLIGRYLFLIRMITYAFAASSAVFCAIVINLMSSPDVVPFRISAGELRPLTGFLPLMGVVCLAIGILLHRKIPDTKWFWQRSSLQRLQMYFLLILLRLTFLEMSILPCMFYFLLGGESDWLVTLSIVAILFMLFTIPGRRVLEDVGR